MPSIFRSNFRYNESHTVNIKKVILPTGSTAIEVGDRVIVFARHDSITEIEKIFSVGIGFY